jgi:D-alanyl-lipoteichoic acid acyltransferase DltB (MBOAT superfamily)
MLTMLLCGLWHGAGWTFIAWGALHGAAICINRAWLKTRISLPKSLAWTLTIAFVIVGWVLFRAENFGVAAEILSAMIGIDGATLAGASLDDVTIVILGAMFAVLGPTNKVISESPALLKRGYAVAAGCGLFLVALRVGQGRGLEFIYFQF